MSKTEIAERAGTARQHQIVAVLTLPPADRQGSSAEAQVAASNAVLAGIAASDALCGYAMGRRAAGQDHRDAVKLLAQVRPDGPALSRKLSRLVTDKTQLQYGGYCSRARAAEMMKNSGALIEALADRGL